MTTHVASRALAAPILALALASPARAEPLPCEGITCVLAIPAAVVYIGVIRLMPAPVLIKAVEAMHEGDVPKLKRLLAAHPELVRLTPEQSQAMAKMEVTGRKGIEERYVLSPEIDYTAKTGMIEECIETGDWKDLEERLKMDRRLARAVDNGYVLLVESARTGNLDAVRVLLDAGVPADAHKGGALREAIGDEIKQLLLSRASPPQKPGNAEVKGPAASVR